MATKPKVVWEGAEDIAGFLVPIDELEPFPGNPRRGSIPDLCVSLRRWGQLRTVLVDPELGAEGRRRVIAGHHIILAATELGWTHVAATRNTFADEEDARAYLVADNHLPELGGYDQEELVAHLKLLAELDGLDGTGYTRETVDEEFAALRRMQERLDQDLPSPLDSNGKREHRDPAMKELVLLFNPDQLNQVELWLSIVAKEKGTSGTSETAFAAFEIAARHLNLDV